MIALSIDEAISILMQHRLDAKYGGDTCLVISLDNSDIEEVNVYDLCLQQDKDGAVVEVRGKLQMCPDLI